MVMVISQLVISLLAGLVISSADDWGNGYIGTGIAFGGLFGILSVPLLHALIVPANEIVKTKTTQEESWHKNFWGWIMGGPFFIGRAFFSFGRPAPQIVSLAWQSYIALFVSSTFITIRSSSSSDSLHLRSNNIFFFSICLLFYI
jgi:hypothetical protein